jgi:hypothetical protein
LFFFVSNRPLKGRRDITSTEGRGESIEGRRERLHRTERSEREAARHTTSVEGRGSREERVLCVSVKRGYRVLGFGCLLDEGKKNLHYYYI